MSIILTAILFILILAILVLSHEFGHFIVAKKAGLRVDEFGFGFPPRIWSKKIGETVYSINALPLGGFVKIFGEDGVKENDDPEGKLLNQEILATSYGASGKDKSFAGAPKKIQALILIAGVTMNIILAWFLFSIGLSFGLPSSVGDTNNKFTKFSNINLTVIDISKDSPAEKIGLKAGDAIFSLHTDKDFLAKPVEPALVQSFVKAHAGEEIHIEVMRKNEAMEFPVTLEKIDPKLGISMDVIGIKKVIFPLSFWEGAKLTGSIFYSTVVSFVHLIRDSILGKADLSSIAGPLGIASIVGSAAKISFAYLISFIALISVNLAVINLVPFPALDGGRLLFVLIEKIKGSPVPVKVAGIMNGIGFVLLLLLMAIVTYQDIVRMF